MNKILIVCNQHGNELLGDIFRQYLEAKNSLLLASIDFYNANPMAKRKKVRYINCDMNRSYRPKSSNLNYEEKQAQKILQKAKKYDLVLDMHTTVCKQPNSIILCQKNLVNRQVLKFAQNTSLVDMILMPSSIAKDSLIGDIDNSLSFEVNNSHAENLNVELEQAIGRYLGENNQKFSSRKYVKKNLYIIDGKIEKNPENMKKSFINLKKCPDGFYPFLTGANNSYRLKSHYKYLGFKATQKIKIVV